MEEWRFADSDQWVHSSGSSFTRGTVLRSWVPQEEIDRITAASEERRFWDQYARRTAHARGPDGEPCGCSRCVRLHATCEWLSGFGLNVIGTVTYSDEYASRRGIYSIARALDDVREGLRCVPMKAGRRTGFMGPYVLCGEHHPSGRNVPHVHLALATAREPAGAVCSELWSYFYATRGRSRFEPMRDTSKATLYGLKDTVKSADLHGDWIVTRLDHARVGKHRRRS